MENMSKKIIILILFGYVSINGFAQINIDRDSILIKPGIVKDTMKINSFDIDTTLNYEIVSQDSLVRDTIVRKNSKDKLHHSLLKSVKIQGVISNGYDYGVSPYVFNHGVTGFYKSEGNVGIEVLSLPLNVRYNYSTLNVIGLNNYFSVSFDVNKYKDNLKKKISNFEERYTSQVDSLFLRRQKLVQKKAFMEREIESKLQKIENSKNIDYSKYTSTDRLKNNLIPDSLLNKKFSSGFTFDTLNQNVPNIDSLAIPPRLPKNSFTISKSSEIDSLQGVVDEYVQKAEQLNNQITEIDNTIQKAQKSIQSIKNFSNKNSLDTENIKGLNKFKQYLFDVKKFEVGLCYPSYSNFLIKGAAIKGVNVEFENKDCFIAFTHGTSVNTFVNPLNAVESNLNKFKQMFDFLDFNNSGEHRSLTSMMVGYGKKQGNHLHAGFLYGIGNASMFYYSSMANSVDKNYVLELDGRALINKSSYVDFSYGKSSLQGENEILASNERGFSGIFTSNRTNAALVSLHTQIPILKTKVQMSVRWLDPYFKSYGIGFLKSDNLRYELKVDQRLSKRVNVNCLYRKSEDNLLNLFDYKNKLNTIGAGVNVKWSRRLTTKVNYNMIIQSMDLNNENSYHSNSYISTYILNYQIPKAKTLITGIFNDYKIADANSINRFQNVLISSTTDIGKKIKNSLTINMLNSNMKDSLTGNSTMISNDVIMIQRRVLISVNGKYAIIKGKDNQFGYGLKATVSLCKSITMEGSFERIVYGSYYNYITAEQIEKFPYYCSIKINYLWR